MTEMTNGCFSGKEKKRGGCCTPIAPHFTDHVPHPLAEFEVKNIAGAENMIALPGGTFLMGTDYPDGFPADGEGPVRAVTLNPFSIDRSPVTNRGFQQFTEETGYCTEAEIFGWSFVFWAHVPPDRFHELVQDTVAQAPWWCKVLGATWNSPEGPGSHIKDRADHAVVHVSWNDAAAYACWAGKRLPTEAEWEYAARGGLEQKLYPWGDKLRPGGEHRCNIWQGEFPRLDTADDGYAGTCPVNAFPPNGFGLYSVTGNTWEWCADWFDAEFHRIADRNNPQGPPSGTARVIKGGSFLCHNSYCNRYRVAARTSNTPDSSTSHVGFRCAV
jgi:formylglycine-generating enzyme required for sulfatase activity